MAIGKAFGGRRLGGRHADDAGDTLPAPANDVDEALESAVGAAVETETPAPAGRKPDPLLAALQYLARRWGRPISRDVLVAGLPLKNGLLTMPLLSQAEHEQRTGALQSLRVSLPLPTTAPFPRSLDQLFVGTNSKGS